ncbi:MAG: hypothetical protein GY765_24195 [bacterium]|nr:hypothetical protein [bacterium]
MEKVKSKSELPPKDAEAWFEYIHQMESQTPGRLEDVAKFLTSMVSISLAVFIAGAGGKLEVNTWTGIALGIWLLSLLLSFLVMFPIRYEYVSTSVESIKKMHARIVKHKWRMLIAASACFLVALGILVFQMF